MKFVIPFKIYIRKFIGIQDWALTLPNKSNISYLEPQLYKHALFNIPKYLLYTLFLLLGLSFISASNRASTSMSYNIQRNT